MFINPDIVDQGQGKIRLDRVSLMFKNQGFAVTKKKFQLPLFLQLKVFAEWLHANPCSFEKRIIDISSPSVTKVWDKKHLPIVTTPINSIDILKSKRMLIIVQLSEATTSHVDNFGHCVVRFRNLKQTDPNTYQGIVTGPIIGYNAVLG